jgi:hypothetical protein
MIQDLFVAWLSVKAFKTHDLWRKWRDKKWSHALICIFKAGNGSHVDRLWGVVLVC